MQRFQNAFSDALPALQHVLCRVLGIHPCQLLQSLPRQQALCLPMLQVEMQPLPDMKSRWRKSLSLQGRTPSNLYCTMYQLSGLPVQSHQASHP